MIRTAVANDAAAIAVVHVRSWQATYAGHFPQAFLDGLDPAEWGQWWKRSLEQGSREGKTVLVVEADGVVVGFAGVGPSRDQDAASAEGEVWAIYLLPDRWAQGLGRQLIDAARGRLYQMGYAEAILWVLDTNDRARRFYEAGEWVADGASKIDESLGFPMAEVRLRRRLP